MKVIGCDGNHPHTMETCKEAAENLYIDYPNAIC